MFGVRYYNQVAEWFEGIVRCILLQHKSIAVDVDVDVFKN